MAPDRALLAHPRLEDLHSAVPGRQDHRSLAARDLLAIIFNILDLALVLVCRRGHRSVLAQDTLCLDLWNQVTA